MKAQECFFHTQPKNVCKTFLFFFVFFALVMACFEIAMYDMRACNEHRVTKKYQSTFINLPYTMVVNCNTVLFEFGALNAAH